MEQQLVLFSTINPMMDDVKVVARCVRAWKSHPIGKPNEPWGLDVILQDPEGNRIHASVSKEHMNKFLAVLDDGSCYKISNFGVYENSGKTPLLNHEYKLNFYKNTILTRVNHFDQNLRGFKFEPFQNFGVKTYSESDFVDVIGTIVSISDLIPFEGGGKEKMRRTVILQDVNDNQVECCFYEAWALKFNDVYDNIKKSTSPVVMILQLARIKEFNGKSSISVALFATKLYLDSKLPEIMAFSKRYQATDGYAENGHAIKEFTPTKKEITSNEFFSNGIKKMVGNFRDPGYSYDCIVYGKVHKIHKELGWTYIGCKKCGTKVTDFDLVSSSSSAKINKAKKKAWNCKKCKKEISLVGPRYKVVVRVIDDTGSAQFILFDDLTNKLVGIPCYKLKEKYGPDAEDMFPEELTKNIVGKMLLFRFKYSSYHIENNHHQYTIAMMSDNKEWVKEFKKDFIFEADNCEMDTPLQNVVANTSQLRVHESVPFDLEATPESAKGHGTKNVDADSPDSNMSDVGSGGKRERIFIDLDDYDEVEAEANRAKKPMVAIKIEKE